jgi:hypothetical protein
MAKCFCWKYFAEKSLFSENNTPKNYKIEEGVAKVLLTNYIFHKFLK